MKKLVLLLAVVFSVSLFSCGNKAAETTEAPEVEATEVEAAAVEAPACCQAQDSCCQAGDSCCQAAAVVEEAVAE